MKAHIEITRENAYGLLIDALSDDGIDAVDNAEDNFDRAYYGHADFWLSVAEFVFWNEWAF